MMYKYIFSFIIFCFSINAGAYNNALFKSATLKPQSEQVDLLINCSAANYVLGNFEKNYNRKMTFQNSGLAMSQIAGRGDSWAATKIDKLVRTSVKSIESGNIEMDRVVRQTQAECEAYWNKY